MKIARKWLVGICLLVGSMALQAQESSYLEGFFYSEDSVMQANFEGGFVNGILHVISSKSLYGVNTTDLSEVWFEKFEKKSKEIRRLQALVFACWGEVSLQWSEVETARRHGFNEGTRIARILSETEEPLLLATVFYKLEQIESSLCSKFEKVHFSLFCNSNYTSYCRIANKVKTEL